ncbi:antibiotic biosynthesis monooxygenase family protein [Georgenia subflava]|uniref:Antibiotic biosynthesis monooxygenase n=1 Tax=Georgenia subflava TaxID=1622177 RepID=A0A6N7EP08_9MICO|nr:antibiotic biosynthesis monooxygenase family protein [Georgenia subflava]MPV36964.1 antibiotic biosynthesis monooxygenase [Georgenia subflava]
MSIVKINAITVPPDSGDELAHRFSARTRAMDGIDGFLGFELLRPTDGRHTWLVVTRWRDDVAYEAWVGSEGFAAGHGRGAGARGDSAVDDAGRGSAPHSGETPSGEEGSTQREGRRPVGVSAELWSFDIAGGSGVD